MTAKKVRMTLVGTDGNAWSIMGLWTRKARQQGWTKEERTEVLREARSGDYNHLLATITEHTTEEPTWTFKRILADPKGRELIEQLEWGASDPALEREWKDELLERFDFEYEDANE